MLPKAGSIKTAVQNMLDGAIDLGIRHAENEIGLQPKTFARSVRPLIGSINTVLEEYARTRAFWITGIIKQDILDQTKAMLFAWTKTHLEPYPDDQLVSDITLLLKDYLPIGVNAAARAETIARTNINDMYNYTRVQVLSAPELSGFVMAFMYSAILDGRTTEICRTLNGRIMTKDEVPRWLPPNHYNCRSVIVPVTSMDRGWEAAYMAQPPIPADVSPQEGF